MIDSLVALFRRHIPEPAVRPRLTQDQWPAAVYAIGDVHGCLDQLRALEKKILADAAGIEGDKWIVQLGDLVDRGPDSAGVLDHVMARPPAGFRRICLAGNHEAMMSAFIADPSPSSAWLDFGGYETLESYGINPISVRQSSPRKIRQILDSHLPSDHIDFLSTLPSLVRLPGTVLVHAGLRPEIPLDDQVDEDLLWIREPFLSAETHQARIVHGHTPVAAPFVGASRICLDTGAFATGTLTAARLTADACTIISVTS